MTGKLFAIGLMIVSLALFGYSAFIYPFTTVELVLLAVLLLIAVYTLRISCEPRKLQSFLILFFALAVGESIMNYTFIGINNIVILSGVINLFGLVVSLKGRQRFIPDTVKLSSKGMELQKQLDGVSSVKPSVSIVAVGKKKRKTKKKNKKRNKNISNGKAKSGVKGKLKSKVKGGAKVKGKAKSGARKARKKK